MTDASWARSLEATLTSLPSRRGFRLLVLGLLVALVFPAARLVWLGILALAYFWPLVDGLFHAWSSGSTAAGLTLARQRMPFLPAVVVVLVLVALVGLMAQVGLHRERVAFDDFRRSAVLSRIGLERDRPYPGESWGLRGPVELELRVAGGTVADDPATPGVEGIRILRHSDSLSVGAEGMHRMARRLVEASQRGTSLAAVDAVSGATYSSLAVREGVLDALWRVKGQSRQGPLARALFWLVGNDLGRFVVSASAIVFIVGLLFEFCLGPFLRRESGVTLPCYNCQTCVGVCPVKMVEGLPFPMTMVTELRVGNVAHAAELARYCVGCSRCASRCPVGLSGASVGSAAIGLARRLRAGTEGGDDGSR